jgi:hypothetical protein
MGQIYHWIPIGFDRFSLVLNHSLALSARTYGF